MQNFKLKIFTPIFALLLFSFCLQAQGQAQDQAKGFALGRMYFSAPGAAWFVMDDLSMDGKLGGTVNLTVDHAHNPLVVRSADGTHSLAVVSEEQVADFGLAATYSRYRIYLNLTGPTYLRGNSDAIDGESFAGPRVDLGAQPDTVSDMRFGLDARVIGERESPFRLGVGAQIFVPSGNQSDYVSDGTYRAMLRLLVAGDSESFAYSGQTGVHFRKTQDVTPGSPKGSEFLFGLAGGERFKLASSVSIVIGPEIYGASAFRSFLRPAATDFEWLLTTRIVQKQIGNRQCMVRLGAGSGFAPQFGAPEWRAVLGVELSGTSDQHDSSPGLN